MFALTSTYCCINFLIGILPWTHDMSTMNLVTIVSHMAICGSTEVVPSVCTLTKPWKFTGYCLEISLTPMNKRTTCLYCHCFSSIPPELPGCVVPSLEKSGYTSSTDSNREPQAASHAWWIIHTTGHHLDIETKMLRNRAEQVLLIPPLADSGGMAPFGHVWPHADRLFFCHFIFFHVCFVFSTKTFLKLLMVSVMMVAQWWWFCRWFWDADLDQGMAWPRVVRASGNDMAANYIVLMISIGSYINNKFIDSTIILNN